MTTEYPEHEKLLNEPTVTDAPDDVYVHFFPGALEALLHSTPRTRRWPPCPHCGAIGTFRDVDGTIVPWVSNGQRGAHVWRCARKQAQQSERVI